MENQETKCKLVNNKPKNDILDNSGVYGLICKNCYAVYFGQSGRYTKQE